MTKKKKILFVCTVNRMRSATANEIYRDDPRFEVKSAGTSPYAKNVVSKELLEWADSIIVMERAHRNQIRKRFPDIYSSKPIVCLYIPDEYEFMDEGLISLLKMKFEDVHTRGLI